MGILSAEVPQTTKNALTRRAYGYCVRFGRYGYYSTCKRSIWSRFGSWILAGLMVFLGIITIIAALICLTIRRRRSRRHRISTNTPAYNTTQQGYHDQSQTYAPPPNAPPKYGGPEPYGGVTQPPNAYVQ
ncbi:hypothetical protein OnM2_077037 [Erysiphe neolycopersici]|uniref:Chitin synthesis regulation, Congo red resistance, RCR protein n=1 Tax=Erysiphe neolycopersici TaxID=212602 RepID=A0A420HFG1_9PEZI|nr:hypothetical protein OnM2_083036 [Erysiphe neolycopersici]RKF57054.1 hypothetical protein OnM2_077037 [Erysiphe neolycopersici]